jgi:hypothetical protein
MGIFMYNAMEILIALFLGYICFFKTEMLVTKIFKKYNNNLRNLAYLFGFVSLLRIFTL